MLTLYDIGLDNLPNEVQHLLQEIKIKEQQCQGKSCSSHNYENKALQCTFYCRHETHSKNAFLIIIHLTEIQQDIAKDQLKYIKSSLKQCSSLPSNTAGSGEQIKSATASPTPNGSNSKAHLPGRISAAYAEIEALTAEKISIAQQIIELLTRTRARLDGDLSKVRILQGESPEDIRLSVFPNVAHELPLSSPYGTKRHVGGDNSVISPVIQIGESLRAAVGAGKSDTIHSIPAASGPAYKSKSVY